MKTIRSSVITLLILQLFACDSPLDKEGTYIPENLDRREKLRYQQYLVQGATLYKKNCSNCHGKNGEGIGKLYPPLAKADYLKDNPSKSACIIKYGLKEEIFVNGVDYNMEMPANESLSAIEIAEIMTFISNSWGNETGFVSVQDINGYLENCD